MRDRVKLILGIIIAAILVVVGVWYDKTRQSKRIIVEPEDSLTQATSTGDTQQPNQTQELQKPISGNGGKSNTINIFGWKTYKNSSYKIELQYPSNWNLKESYLNTVVADVLVSPISGTYVDTAGKMQVSTIDQVVSSEIIVRNFENFGKNPTASKTTAGGKEARIITSKDGEGAVRQALIVKYPNAVNISNVDYYYFMVKVFKSGYIDKIKSTLKFL